MTRITPTHRTLLQSLLSASIVCQLPFGHVSSVMIMQSAAWSFTLKNMMNWTRTQNYQDLFKFKIPGPESRISQYQPVHDSLLWGLSTSDPEFQTKIIKIGLYISELCSGGIWTVQVAEMNSYGHEGPSTFLIYDLFYLDYFNNPISLSKKLFPLDRPLF